MVDTLSINKFIKIWRNHFSSKLTWQSILSVIPPCPGILSPKSCGRKKKRGWGYRKYCEYLGSLAFMFDSLD